LKPLLDFLKYTFLRPDESLSVIIASDLEDDRLIALLRENKKAISWTLGDIKDIGPSIVLYRIHLEDNAKPHRYSHFEPNFA